MMNRVLLSQAEVLTIRGEEMAEPQVGWVGIEGSDIVLVSFDEQEAARWAEGSDSEAIVTTEIIDCRGKILMPGLINTHSHISMTLMRNYADDMELHEWLNNYIWRFEAKMSREDMYVGAKLAVAEMLAGGTTTVVDMYFNEDIIANAVRELGMRALLTETALDFNVEDFEQRMDRLREVADGDVIMAGVAPHAPYTCSRETLRRVVDYAAKYDLPIHTHLAETQFEAQTINEMYGLTPFEYFEQCGVITNKTLLAHAIYLSHAEIEKIAAAGASVLHNPQSNMKLASGVAPVVEMLNAGVNVTIATDGVSSNNDLDMWEEMRSAALLQRVQNLSPTVMPAKKVLYMATRAAALAIGRTDLGEIAVGRKADIIIVDNSAPHMQPRHNILSALLYSAKSTDVELTIVNGKIVNINSNTLSDIIASANIITQKITAQLTH